MDITTITLLGLAALVAGCIDAVAGGGGLITLPALLAAGLPPVEALATNKGQSTWGSTVALFRFSRTPLLDRNSAPWAFAAAMAGAIVGVLVLRAVPNQALRPLVLVLLLAAAVLVLVVRPKPRIAAIRRPLWWSLALGACLGGNGTLIGASANVVVASMAAKRGKQISFIGYMKIAFPVMILSILISSVYVYWRYL